MEGTEVTKLAALEGTHWWYRERRALLSQAIRGLAPGLALDIGAAGGGNTQVLTSAGWRACALEYGVEGAQVAAGRGLAVVRADAMRLPFADACADLVTALDVLEHLDRDGDAAAEIHRVLRPGGRLVVTVPVDMALWSEHDVAVGHVRRYTRDEVVQLLEGAGLVVDSAQSWLVLLRPVVALRRRRSTGSDLSETPGVVNAALSAVVRLERLLPLGRLPGVSVLVTAHRPD